MRKDNGKTMYHLHVKTDDSHYYYGSVAAMFENHSREVLGVTKNTYYAKQPLEVYENDKVVIRRDTMVRAKRGRRLNQKLK